MTKFTVPLQIETLIKSIINYSRDYQEPIPEDVPKAANINTKILNLISEVQVKEKESARLKIQKRLYILKNDVDSLTNDLLASDFFGDVSNYSIRRKRIEKVCAEIGDSSILEDLRNAIDVMNSKILNRNLESILSLKQGFDFNTVYKATLLTAISLINNVPAEIKIANIETYFIGEVKRYITEFSDSLFNVTMNLYKSSLRQEPDFENLKKIVGANISLINLGIEKHDTHEFHSLHQQYLKIRNSTLW